MIYIKKIIFVIIKSSVYLALSSILIIFFYATFFFVPPAVERNTIEKQITKSEESSTPSIEEVEPKKEIVKLDTPKIEVAIKNSLFATVGNKAVTQWDILNEIKIILILTGQSFSENIKEQLQSAAIQSTIKRNIKKIEIEKRNFLTFNQDDLDNELKELANNINMDYDTFKNTFIANEIDFSQVVDQIRTELLWNSLIFELYKDELVINIDEINEQLTSIQNKKEIEEYLISEIIIRQVPKDKLESTIKEIRNKIKIEGFEKVAMSLSISNTALKGGNLGWVSENAISEKFKSKIINTPIDNISEPILLPEGILLFKVRDKRKLKKFSDLEDAKNQLVKAEKTKMLRMHSLSLYENLKKSISINYY